MASLVRGTNVHLRAMTEEDASPAYVSWLNDDTTTRYLESGGDATIQSVRDYIREQLAKTEVLFLAIVTNSDQRHVGNIKFEPVNRKHGTATLGIMIGDPGIRGKGIGTEAMTLALRYAFEQAGLHRVDLGVAADNTAAIRCYEKVGFSVEGRLREAVARADCRQDTLWMGILASEFRKVHDSTAGRQA